MGVPIVEQPKKRGPRRVGSTYMRKVTRLNPQTGERELVRTYYEYARDLAPEQLTYGVSRQRIVGCEPTQAIARKRYQENLESFHS